MHKWRRGVGRGAAALTILVACALVALSGQSRRFDADDLRAAYDTYRSMQRASPYAPLRWQPLGPTNISGRATDIAVADRGSSRRIYPAYAPTAPGHTHNHGTTRQP